MSELMRIDEHRRQVGVDRGVEDDVAGQHAVEQPHRARDDIGDVHQAGLQQLASAEGEQLLCHQRGTIRRLADLRHVFSARVVFVEGPDQELGIAEDRRELVVEVVSNPAGEAPDRVELLRFAQLLLEADALGYVTQDDHRSDQQAGAGADG